MNIASILLDPMTFSIKIVSLKQHSNPRHEVHPIERHVRWSAGNLDKYGESVSVSRIAVAYTKHAEGYYVKDGEKTSQLANVKLALKTLVNEFGKVDAGRFKPSHLEKLQQAYLKAGMSRQTINRYVNIVRQAFRFAVTKGSVSAEVWQALLAVRNLQRGRSEAKETKPVLPVSPQVVIATLRELGPAGTRTKEHPANFFMLLINI